MENLFHTIRLPGIVIPGNVFLAPLAGFTDRSFRSICIAAGASFTCTEMVSAEALVRESRKTRNLAAPADNETMYAVQLFASDPESAGEAARIISEFEPDVIDLNCGCPVPKIIKAGAGSALLRDPGRIRAIVSAVRESTDIPVSVKIRSGWDSSTLNFLETAGAALAGGAELIGFHPRTRSQGYGGRAAWEHIGLLKETFPDIPVIGSGDLHTPEDAKRMLETTGCDGIMFARGALGNPFIFTQTRELLEHGKIISVEGPERRLLTGWEHYLMMVRDKGEKTASKEMRKHFCSYSKGIRSGAAFRNAVVHAGSVEEYRSILNEFLDEYGIRI